jgi:hypothetical protein
MKKVLYAFDSRRNRRLLQRKNQKHQPEHIIILTTNVMIHTATAVLDMPEGNADRGQRAKEVTDACEDSTYVTVPPATITAVRARITAYNNADPATRPNLYRLMNNDLKAMMSLFQQAADADPENAVAIIESGKFKVKEIPMHQKQEWAVENSLISGRVDLTAPGGPQYSCHDWRYSADRINWVRMSPTIEAHTHKDGLVPKRMAYFTHELIIKDGPQGVSQVLEIEVQ